MESAFNAGWKRTSWLVKEKPVLFYVPNLETRFQWNVINHLLILLTQAFPPKKKSPVPINLQVQTVSFREGVFFLECNPEKFHMVHLKNRQHVQVPKMEALNLTNLTNFFGGGFSLAYALHTAYTGEYLHFWYLKCLVKKGTSVWREELNLETVMASGSKRCPPEN